LHDFVNSHNKCHTALYVLVTPQATMHKVLHWRLKLFPWKLQLYNIWALMTFPCCSGHAELLRRSALPKLYVSGWNHLLHWTKWTNTVCISEAVKIHVLSVSVWCGVD